MDIKMDEVQLKGISVKLNSFTEGTLRYLYWTVGKLCKLIELSTDKEWIEYELQPKYEERDIKNGFAPTPKIEAEIMQTLQSYSFFKFQPLLFGSDKPIIIGGDSGLQGEAAERMVNDPRSNLEIKFEKGWFVEHDINALKRYLVCINEALQKHTQTKPKLIFYKREGKIQHMPLDGESSEDEFKEGTNEYNILLHLANNTGMPFLTGQLVQYLKEVRQGADSPDPKRRVTDSITAIRKKLGKTVIKTTPNGYKVDCEVIKE